MTEIDRLNRRLGEELGTVASGTRPRFAWKMASTMPLWRRLGDVWVLCQWTQNSMDADKWFTEFRGRYPYPGEFTYQAYAESALLPGMLPTPEMTQFYIHTIDRQMTMTYRKQMAEDADRRAAQKKIDDKEWVDFVQESGEAFCNPLIGKVAVPQYMGRQAV